MVSKRQSLARKRFRESNPHLFAKLQQPNQQGLDDHDHTRKKRKKSRLSKRKPKKLTEEMDAKGETAATESMGKKGKQKFLKKHPLRVPGMKPGEGCFICKAADHIAKLCPKKSLWEKNKICLHCRKRGHSLKNCRDKSDANGQKYCYNCGEAGHSLSNCSHPLQDGGTKFANCFICNERGHLSKNCPKSTHGIYPKGGSCKTCGGITHLAKDCPEKGNKNITIGGGKEETQTLSEHGEIRRGKVTIFRSGDDLEDDFAVEGDGKKGTTPVLLGAKAEKEIDERPKTKLATRVVNFLG